MLIVELTYKVPLEKVNQSLESHRDFLATAYAQGKMIASGPKEPRDGGIILSKIDKKDMEKLIQDDPFYVEGIADYRIIEFSPNRVADNISDCFTL